MQLQTEQGQLTQKNKEILSCDIQHGRNNRSRNKVGNWVDLEARMVKDKVLWVWDTSLHGHTICYLN